MPGFAEMAETLRRSVVQIFSREGGGSGIVWDARGLVLTNAHVARGREAEVADAQGRRFRARVVARDREQDLALLETAAALTPARFGDSQLVRPGNVVVAVGNPFGIAGALAFGMVHAAGGKWIEADIRLAPGNSGGILANAEGQAIGMNTMIFNGLGLAIPSNRAALFARRGTEARAA